MLPAEWQSFYIHHRQASHAAFPLLTLQHGVDAPAQNSRHLLGQGLCLSCYRWRNGHRLDGDASTGCKWYNQSANFPSVWLLSDTHECLLQAPKSTSPAGEWRCSRTRRSPITRMKQGKSYRRSARHNCKSPNELTR